MWSHTSRMTERSQMIDATGWPREVRDTHVDSKKEDFLSAQNQGGCYDLSCFVMYTLIFVVLSYSFPVLPCLLLPVLSCLTSL